MPKKTTNPEETTPKFTDGPASKRWDGLTSWPRMQPIPPTVDEPEKTPNKRKNQAATEPKNPKKKKAKTFEELCEQERVGEAYGRGRSITPPVTQEQSPPNSPTYAPISPPYRPDSPAYSPTSPPYVSESPPPGDEDPSRSPAY